MLCYRSTADHRAAVAALADLRQRGVAADRYAFNAAIRVCADAGADDEALRLLGALREAAAAERAAASGLGVQPRGQPQAATRHGSSGEGAVSSASSSRGVMQPDCRSYSAALAAIEAAGRQHRAVQLQRWMEEDGVVPDATLCTQFLACYAAAGQAAAAQHLFDLMAAGARGLGLGHAGRVPVFPPHMLVSHMPGWFRRSHAALPWLGTCDSPLCPSPLPTRLVQPARRRPTAHTGMRCCWLMPRPGMWRAVLQPTAA